MTQRPCEAVLEIQAGRLTLQDFLPRQALDSGTFSSFGVLIGDLRSHLATCATCRVAGNKLRAQIKDLDDLWVSHLEKKLQPILEGLDEADADLEEARERPHALGGPSADVLDELESMRDLAYFEAVKRCVEVGKALREVLQSLFRTTDTPLSEDGSEGLAIVPTTAGQYSDLAVPELALHVLGASGEEKIRMSLLVLLLSESFYGFFDRPARTERSDFFGTGEEMELEVLSLDGIEWSRIWNHFSTLSQVYARRPYEGAPGHGSSVSSELTERMDTALEMLVAIGERTERLLSGQTAIMGVLEHATRELQTKFEEAPSHVKDSCEGTVRCALAPLWEGLEEQSRRWLVTAEYGYSQFPSELDFSGVILLFTKAFEHELKRAIKPIQGELEKFVRSDVSLPRKPLTRYTLGDFLNVLRAGKHTLDPLLHTRGLAYDAVYTAVQKVNTQAPAKHLAPRGKVDATTFRASFLGRPSVLAALFPATNGDT